MREAVEISSDFAGKSDRHNAPPAARGGTGALTGLQKSLGNQAMVRLFNTGAIQAKLRVSQPGDPDEIEANRVADQVAASQKVETIHRSCACSGSTPCSKCASDEEEQLVQRAPARDNFAHTEKAQEATGERKENRRSRHFIVEDDGPAPGLGQMKKLQFMQSLRNVVCVTADAALVATGRTATGCPYIEKWLAFYSEQSAERIERTLHKYAPETKTARSINDYFTQIQKRVQRAVTEWAKTGKLVDVPPGAPITLGSAKDGLNEGAPTTGAPRVLPKAKDSGSTANSPDVHAVKDRLGSGSPLESNVRTRMETAFERDFSRVRLHTDSTASTLSTELNARAFTIGNNVAFAPGEYRPGTMIGDALIAHELAHVVQQGNGTEASTDQGAGQNARLEEEADNSAVNAVASIFTRGRVALGRTWTRVAPGIKSGLRLQRCESHRKKCPSNRHWGVVAPPAGGGSLGCLCRWECVSGPPPKPASADSSGPAISCPPDRYCAGPPPIDEVGPDYQQVGEGKLGYGAQAMQGDPMTGEKVCLCIPPNDLVGADTPPPIKTGFDPTDLYTGPLPGDKGGGGTHEGRIEERPAEVRPAETGRVTEGTGSPPPKARSEGSVAQHGKPPETAKTETKGMDAKDSVPAPPPVKTDVKPAPQAKQPEANTAPPPTNSADTQSDVKTPDDHPQAKGTDAKTDSKPAPDTKTELEKKQQSPASSDVKPQHKAAPDDKTDQAGLSQQKDAVKQETKDQPESSKEREKREENKSSEKETETPKQDSTAQVPGPRVDETQINRVQQMEQENQQLSDQAKAAEPGLKQAKEKLDQARKTATELADQASGLKAFTDEAAKRNPGLASQVKKANEIRQKLKKARREESRAEAEHGKLAADQSARYEKIRSNKAEIEKIARPELALKPTLRGVANELRVLKEEGLLGIKKQFTLKDPKTGEWATTIPDGMRPSGATVDVKDVAELSETQQLRLQREVSRRAGQKPEIITGTKTKVPSDMLQNYNIRRRPDLGPR